MSAPATALVVEPLTREAFVPFGAVVEASAAARHYPINGGSTVRYHDLAPLDAGPGGRLVVSVFRAQPRAMPMRIAMLERHPLASQTFVPMFGDTARRGYLVVVAPPGDAPDASALRCFLAGAGQGVHYAPGVWHHPLIALDEVSDFLVIDREGEDANCDEVDLRDVATIDV